MFKKYKFSDIISLISIVIAAFALCFSYIVYKESRSIVFQWDVNSRNDIPIKLGKRHDYNLLPIWLQFKITNTGSRTFSVDSIHVLIKALGRKDRDMSKMYYELHWITMKPILSVGIAEKDKIFFPIVVDPGHSKMFYNEIGLPITKKQYDGYQREFHGQAFTLGDNYRLNKDELLMCKNFKIIAEVRLSSGEYKSADVTIDADDYKK